MYLFGINKQINKGMEERIREGDREEVRKRKNKVNFHPLLNSSNMHNDWGWVG